MASTMTERLEALAEKRQKLEQKRDAKIIQLVRAQLGEPMDENVLAGALAVALRSHNSKELEQIGAQWFRERRPVAKKTAKGDAANAAKSRKEPPPGDDDERLL